MHKTMKKIHLWPLLALLFCSSMPHRSTLRPNKDYALFFAVNDYAPGSGFDDLGKPIENVEEIAKELRDRYGFQTEIVRNPTLDQISAKLREYQSLYAKNPQGKYPATGQLLIYFTGHGISEDNNGYFVPADGNIKKLYSTAFAYEIWRPFINKIDCRHILLAIDACYSVTFDPDWYNRKMGNETFKRPGELSEGDKLLQTNESDQCRIVFTSDGSEDKVPERSNFARKFLEGLRNGPRQDGILTSEGLAGYLRFSAPKPRLTEFGSDDKGSFVFVSVLPTVSADPPDIASDQNLEKDLQAWRAAKAANTIAAYRDYRARFEKGEFREQAQNAIDAIERDLALRRDDLAWEVATEKNTPEGYQKYRTDFPNGRHYAEAAIKTAQPKTTVTPTTISDGFIHITGGTFDMGCTNEQKDCDDDEKPVHKVTLSDFYLSPYEVTQQQWKQVMGNNPSIASKDCDQCPVESVSWEEVQQFLQKLNAQNPGRNYRLPTEAEWEYAARGGNQSKGYLYAGSNNLGLVAWYSGNSGNKTQPVGQRKANELGLYDMSGNVLEWCSDSFGAYPSASQNDPSGPSSGSYRIYRGGSWNVIPKYCHVAGRSYLEPDHHRDIVGFRLARTF